MSPPPSHSPPIEIWGDGKKNFVPQTLHHVSTTVNMDDVDTVSFSDSQEFFARFSDTAFWDDKERVQVLIELYEKHCVSVFTSNLNIALYSTGSCSCSSQTRVSEKPASALRCNRPLVQQVHNLLRRLA